MGAGASAQEQEELRAVFSEFEPSMPTSQLEQALKRAAPNVYQHLQAQVANDPADLASAVQALHDQFSHAHIQLRGGGDASTQDHIVAPVLSRYNSWAVDKQTNLQRGLIASTLRTTHVRTVRFVVGRQAAQSGQAGRTDATSRQPGTFVLHALLDTGAERCAMAPWAAQKSGLTPLIDEAFAHTVVGVGSSRGHGRVHYAIITFLSDPPPAAQDMDDAPATDGEGGKVTPTTPTFLASFDVFEWPASAGKDFDAILGLDFLVRYSALVDFAASSLTLNTAPRDPPRGSVPQPSVPATITVPLHYEQDIEEQDAAASANAAAAAAQLAA